MMMPRSSVPDLSQAATRPGSILVIDDEEIMREILETLLTREGYEVRLAASAAEGLEHARSVPFDAAIVDMMMPGMDGISALDELKKIDDDLPVLMITAFASVENAIAAMKRGAYDYITKPFKLDEINLIIRRALERKRLRDENLYLRKQLETQHRFDNIVADPCTSEKTPEQVPAGQWNAYLFAQDFGQLCHYRAQNAELAKAGNKPRVPELQKRISGGHGPTPAPNRREPPRPR